MRQLDLATRRYGSSSTDWRRLPDVRFAFNFGRIAVSQQTKLKGQSRRIAPRRHVALSQKTLTMGRSILAAVQEWLDSDNGLAKNEFYFNSEDGPEHFNVPTR